MLVAGSVFAAPSVYFAAPRSGNTISGTIQSSACEARGSSIDRVRFYLDSTALNTEEDSPWNCTLDTRKFSDGTHTLRAVAYDRSGVSRSTSISVNIRNGTSSAGPSVSWSAPASGATLSGNIQQSTSGCQVSGSNLARVVFFMDSTQLNTELTAPYLCNVDTTKFADGTHTLKAVAYNSAGASTTISRSVTVKNGTPTSEPTPTPTPTTGPTISFTAPAVGGTLSGNVQGPPNCVVTGSNIARVMFYLNDVWTNTDGNLDNGLGCWIDTTKYPDGAYTVKAVAYDSAGKTATATRSIAIKNSTTAPSPTAGTPVVSFSQPTSGATLKGVINQTAACEVKGTGITQVKFYLDSTALNTELTAPYLCNLDTSKFANGSHTLMAVATNSAGSTTTQVAVKIDNTTASEPTPPTAGSPIDAADIVNQAQASVPFVEQSGYNTQVINTYLSANQIPESGIHGSVLPNGESLRFGKQADPRDSSKKALAFQVAPNDPLTSGSKRAELKFPNNISYDKVYWAAFRHYVEDWGTFSTSDVAMIAMQLHTSGSTNSLSPAVQIASKGGRTFWIDARGSTASTPSHSTSVSVKSPELPIQFGRWVDFVFKVKLNTSGKGFVQVWVDGAQVFNHTGTIGYNGTSPYFKFGYYNWTSFQTPRKVLMKSPVIVADPTGSKYTQDSLRKYIQSK